MTNFGGWDCHLRRAYNSFDYLISFIKEDKDGHTLLLSDLKKTKHVKFGEECNEYTIRINSEMLKDVFDKLWEDGVRPKDRRYENEMSIINNHLQDMRKLVFKKEDS
jgi:hypothetical protein